MNKRGYNHKSPLNKDLVAGDRIQNYMVDSIEEKINILRNKNCKCKI
jgi:hypothetical protein